VSRYPYSYILEQCSLFGGLMSPQRRKAKSASLRLSSSVVSPLFREKDPRAESVCTTAMIVNARAQLPGYSFQKFLSSRTPSVVCKPGDKTPPSKPLPHTLVLEIYITIIIAIAIPSPVFATLEATIKLILHSGNIVQRAVGSNKRHVRVEFHEAPIVESTGQ
jgi:hypothetical protein